MTEQTTKKSKQIGRVAMYGILGNLFLVVIKLMIGFVSRSQAMIADGMNSAGDVFASFMTFIGNRISTQPSDEEHPFGHGKAEHIFSMIISFSLLLVAFNIFRSALNAIINGNSFTYSIWLIIVALVTIALKALLYIHARSVSRSHNSLLAEANAMDHRNDMFVTSLTLLSIITGYFNIFLVDGIVGVILSFFIAYSGVQIFTGAYNVLMDTNIPTNIHLAYSEVVESIEGIDHLDTITAKPLGNNFLLLVKISVDANMSVYDSHAISARVKETLKNYQNVEDVIVHINPTQFHPK